MLHPAYIYPILNYYILYSIIVALCFRLLLANQNMIHTN